MSPRFTTKWPGEVEMGIQEPEAERTRRLGTGVGV
jgi:hypothetical protein